MLAPQGCFNIACSMVREELSEMRMLRSTCGPKRDGCTLQSGLMLHPEMIFLAAFIVLGMEVGKKEITPFTDS